MSGRFQGSVPSPRLRKGAPLVVLLAATAFAENFGVLVQGRTAIERVYFQHRLGQKPPFEQLSPPSLIEELVKGDLRKEAALKKVYGVEITPTLLDAEVQRINTTTRAPEMLAEIKTALGNDRVRFANAFAKPFLVERLLREKFENDDRLHADQRREAERVRAQLLAARRSRGHEAPAPTAASGKQKGETDQSLFTSAATNDCMPALAAILKAGRSNEVSERTWQLGPRPAETNAPAADELEIKRRFGPNAQLISSPPEQKDRKLYFEDLPAELQRVLRVQLQQPGDVSAVIETPGGFLLYLCKERTDQTLSIARLSLPKRSFEQWLSQQPDIP